ncbi:MAG TPA: type II/IV secretion system protein [Firmicutes bacterium]|nr:type II/IV secretion system protein [Bacillota bacterium]
MAELALETSKADNLAATLKGELEANREGAFAINAVNSLIEKAVSLEASDIHIEPQEKGLRVRVRVDGFLQELGLVPQESSLLIITRIKLLAGMDISEKRLPQDGRILYKIVDKQINIRVSSLPTIHGERLVLRLLHQEKIVRPIESLNFSAGSLVQYKEMIGASQGIILITGPTGCGKSTTLYSTINYLYSGEKNIVTVEDPVEYHLEGINQVQVNPKIGFDFSDALRTILRQDPNVIMIGEIRDEKTADIAVRAALTGHLVFSTLHTNDAPGAVTRLLDMKVEGYLIAAALVGVVAQRLVRVICPACKVKTSLGKEEEMRLKRYLPTPIAAGTVYRGKGCPHCNRTGYKGRVAIHEVMRLTNTLKEHINSDYSKSLAEEAKKRGMLTLQEDGMRLVSEGITTVAEVLRVSFAG